MGKKKKHGRLVSILFREYDQGDEVRTSAIYECSVCNNLQGFKQGEKFTHCPDCPKNPDQGWYRTDDPIHFVSRNLNEEYERIETISFKFAQWIADFAGNITFVYSHAIWFIVWIFINTGNGIGGIPQFDPYPYPFLVLVVSLEAIFLATFILIAQNIQGQRSELRADIDYNVNIKTEKDVAEILSILTDIREGRMKLDKKRLVFDEDQKN